MRSRLRRSICRDKRRERAKPGVLRRGENSREPELTSIKGSGDCVKAPETKAGAYRERPARGEPAKMEGAAGHRNHWRRAWPSCTLIGFPQNDHGHLKQSLSANPGREPVADHGCRDAAH